MSQRLGNIVIGGGTGFIGQHLCNLLKSKGYDITIISRMPGPQRLSWNEIQAEGLPKNTKSVINLAGQNVMDFKRRWTPGFKQNVYNSRVNTTSTLSEAIKKADKKPESFIVMSGVGVYKPSTTAEYNEDSNVDEPFDFFSNLCLDWENAADLKGSETRVVNIRSGVVLGRDGGMIKQLYLPFYLGLGGPIGNGNQYLPWIHIKDLTNLILWSIETTEVKGILNGVAPKPATNKEFTAAFAKALRRPAIFPVPVFVFNLLLSPERAVMVTQGQKVLPKKSQNLGFKYSYPDIHSACQGIVRDT